MIMIERTTQNKIAKNDYWDNGMQGQIQDLKKEGRRWLRGSPQRFFGAYLSQFRGLFKEFSAKTGGRAPPSGSAPGIRFVEQVTLVRTYQRKPPSKIRTRYINNVPHEIY